MGHSVYCKHGSENSRSSFLAISFLCVFICAALLGSLRLYCLYLEHRISETTRHIEQCQEENQEMSKRFSELLSPARIYSYAREELGMVNAENITTVQLAASSVRTDERAAVRLADSRIRILDYINPFLSSAHAKN